MRYTIGLGLLVIAVLTGCGAGASSATLSATISETVQGAPSQTWTVSDHTKAEALYQHILSLPTTNPDTYIACAPFSRSYQFIFTNGSHAVLNASFGKCALLLLNTGTAKQVDSTFWTMVNQDVGIPISPP